METTEPGALTRRVQWLGVALEALLRDLGAALGEMEDLNGRLEAAEKRISELEALLRGDLLSHAPGDPFGRLLRQLT